MLLYFSYCVVFVLACSVLLLLINYRKLRPSLKRLSWLLVLNLTVEIISHFFHHLGENNLFLLHIYTLLEFLLLTIYFDSLSNKKLSTNKIIYMIIVSACIILNTVFLQDIFSFNSYAKSLVQVLIIYEAVKYFITRHLRKGNKTIENKDSIIVAAILIYYSGSLLVFMTSGVAHKIIEDGLHINFWVFNAILNLIFQLLVFIAICLELKVKNSSSTLL